MYIHEIGNRCISGIRRDRRYTTDLNNSRTFLAYLDDDDRKGLPSSRRTVRIKYVHASSFSLFFSRSSCITLFSISPVSFLFTHSTSISGISVPSPVSLCTSTPYGRSHERNRWNARRCTHTRAHLRAKEPLMNLAVLRPPVCVSGIVVREKERNETRARNPESRSLCNGIWLKEFYAFQQSSSSGHSISSRECSVKLLFYEKTVISTKFVIDRRKTRSSRVWEYFFVRRATETSLIVDRTRGNFLISLVRTLYVVCTTHDAAPVP